MMRGWWVALASLGVACGNVEGPVEAEPVTAASCAERLAGRAEPRGSLLRDPEAPFEFPPLQNEVPHYELEVALEDLAELAADPESNDMREAVFTTGGRAYPALVRYRGNSSRDWPKKSFRVEFPDDVGFDGRHKLNLLSQWKDCTMMVEKLGYDLLAAMHVPVPRARFVRLSINGRYQGVYLDLERVDKKFTAAHGFPDDDPTIFRCGRKDCELKLGLSSFQKPWEKKTNETWGDPDPADLLCAVNAAPEPGLVETLDRHLELELYLRTLAADALIGNDVVEDSRSYVIHDARNRRWIYVPWDLNNAKTRYQPGSRVGTTAHVDHPLFPYSVTDGYSEIAYQKRLAKDPARDWHPLFSNLTTRVAFHPELRARVLAHLETAFETVFAPEVIGLRIDAMHALLAPWIPGDENVYPEKFADGPRYLKDYVERRTAFLEGEIERFRAVPWGAVLEAVDPAAGTVTIRNRSDVPVDLAGHVLTADLRRRPAANLAGLLDGGASLTVRASDLGLTLSAPGELGLFAGPALDDVRDVLFLGTPETGPLARSPEGRWRAVTR